MGTPKDSLVTRSKILQAAGLLFTEKGFKGVTVREIALSAKVPLGALNYHFRTKEALYREVLLEACRVASVPEDEQAYLLTLPAEHALFEIIKESLALFRDQAESHWQTAILSRECRNPGPVFEELADEYFRPQAEFLNRILSKAANRPATDFSVQFAGISVIGLMETCGLYRRYVAAVSPGLLEHGEKDDWFARQITRMVIRTASA